MTDSAISCGRLRDLARLGRSRARTGRAAPAAGAGIADQPSNIAGGTPPRPRAASSHPGTHDLTESIIE